METGSQGGSPVAADDAPAADPAAAGATTTRRLSIKSHSNSDQADDATSTLNGDADSKATQQQQSHPKRKVKRSSAERMSAASLARKGSLQQKRPAPAHSEEKRTKTLKRATSRTGDLKHRRRFGNGGEKQHQQHGSASSSDDSVRDQLMGLVSRTSSGTPSNSRSSSEEVSPGPETTDSPKQMTPDGQRTPRQGDMPEMDVDGKPTPAAAVKHERDRSSNSPQETPVLPPFSTLDLRQEESPSASQLQLRPFPNVLPSPPSVGNFQALHLPPPQQHQIHVPGFRPLEPQLAQVSNHSTSNQQEQHPLPLSRASISIGAVPCTICGASFKDPSEAHVHAQKHQRPYKCGEPGCESHEGFTSVLELESHRASAHKARPMWPMEPPQVSPSREQLRRQSMPAVAQHQYTSESRSPSMFQTRNGDSDLSLQRQLSQQYPPTPHFQSQPSTTPLLPPPQLPQPHLTQQPIQQQSQPQAHHTQQSAPQDSASDHSGLIPIASTTLSPARPRSQSQIIHGVSQQSSQHQHQQHQQHQQQQQHQQEQQSQQRASRSRNDIPPCPQCGRVAKNHSDARKHQLQHTKPFVCNFPNCKRNTEGFMTVNDLERHKKAVHNMKPRVGSSIGYICSVCQTTGIGDAKWWPRLDNFKAHILRKHKGADMQSVIESSKRLMRPDDTLTVMTMVSDTPSTSSSGLSQGYGLHLAGGYTAVEDREPYISALRQHQMMPSQNQSHAQLPLPHSHQPPQSSHVPLHSHSETSPQSQPSTKVHISPRPQQLPPPLQLQTPQHNHAQLPPLRPTSSAPSGATSGISLPSVLAPSQSTNTHHATPSPQPPHPQSELNPPPHQTQQDSQPDVEMQG